MPSETSLKKSALITMVAKYATAILQLAYTVLLARLLSPEDFGIVAIAQVFVTLFTVFSDMGLGSAIVQRQDLTHQDVSGLFGFAIALGGVLALVFALIGFPMASVYSEARLLGICSGLSISVFFSTANMIPNSVLLKRKKFLLVGIRGIMACIASSIVGVVCAYVGWGPYSIVAFSVTNSVVLFVWNLVSARVVPTFRSSMNSVRKVFNYSVYLFGFNLVNYFSRNLDNLLIGYYFGSAVLGNYNKAYQLMRLPQNYLTNVISPVLHPILSDRQDDIEYIYTTFVKTVKILSILGVFLSVFCFYSAEEIIDVMYGSQWEAAVPCFKLLAVSIWSQMVCGTSGAMFQVLNRTKEQFLRGLMIAAVIAAAIIAGVVMGSVEMVAAFVGIAYYFNFITMNWFLIRRGFGKSVGQFMKLLVPDFASAFGLSLLFVCINFAHIDSAALSLVVRFFVGAFVYLVFLVVFKQMKWLRTLIPKRLRGKIPKWIFER